VAEPVVAAALLLWGGTTLLLGQVRRLARPSLADRLLPYGAGITTAPRRRRVEVATWRDVVAPVCRTIGERIAGVFGVSEDLAVRLQRIDAPTDATAFRVRQVGWATAALAVGTGVAALLGPPPAIALLIALGLPLLAFLALEQSVVSASSQWQRRVFLELPVVCEQLATLLNAGYSLGAALNRVAERGSGACTRGVAGVCGRVRQGLSEAEALREWATLARVPALDRVVAVLALNDDASDLGRLISVEARNIRADVHRELVETMERRGQQVWIPVTVATLVPGVIFLSVPFIEALRAFSGS
jgi:tight adherence protein C